MTKLPSALILIYIITSVSACSFHVKTPIVADYHSLNQFTPTSCSRNDILVALGEPQGKGIHRLDNKTYDLSFYYGLAGKFTLSTAQCDSGTVFVSYEKEKPVNLLYFTSEISGPKISFKKNLSIKELADKLVIGKSDLEKVFDVLGVPDYKGKRINKCIGLTLNIAYYDSSKLQNEGAVKEKWILVGYDDNHIIQDLVWVSSYPEDIKEFGEIEPQQVKQLSRMTVAGLFPVREPLAIKTGTRIDPVQVDALLRKAPKNVDEIAKVLGQPSAFGIKSFKGDDPMILSNWSYSKVAVKGKEHNFIPPGASDEEREELRRGKSYMVMEITQSRLMVGHDKDGRIHEVIWFKPI